jgi:hypothetical protein
VLPATNSAEATCHRIGASQSSDLERLPHLLLQRTRGQDQGECTQRRAQQVDVDRFAARRTESLGNQEITRQDAIVRGKDTA